MCPVVNSSSGFSSPTSEIEHFDKIAYIPSSSCFSANNCPGHTRAPNPNANRRGSGCVAAGIFVDAQVDDEKEVDIGKNREGSNLKGSG